MPCQITYLTENEAEQLAFETAFTVARQRITGAKDDYERPLLGTRGDQRLNLQVSWIAKHYESAGSLIGARRRVAAIMESLQGYDVANTGSSWTVSLADIEICTVGVYVANPHDSRTEDGCARAIYKIRNKEYVLDDVSLPTRRYAFCVRPPADDGARPRIKEIPPTEHFGWMFKSTFADWAEAMNDAFSQISEDKRGSWHELSANAKVCLAYLNYANNGHLGLCLNSTPKRVRSNPGVAFLNAINLDLWKVDLAKIPTTSVLINLYAREPASEGWSAHKTTQSKKNKKNDIADAGLWISQGTVKNRELFCSDVPPEAATTTKSYAELLNESTWSWKQEPFFKVA